MTIEEYILYRIRTLKESKKRIATKKCNGWQELLWEINSRLNELEHIAIEYRLGLKDDGSE